MSVTQEASSSLAFCGEIHLAARDGDLAKVNTLLKANPGYPRIEFSLTASCFSFQKCLRRQAANQAEFSVSTRPASCLPKTTLFRQTRPHS